MVRIFLSELPPFPMLRGDGGKFETAARVRRYHNCNNLEAFEMDRTLCAVSRAELRFGMYLDESSTSLPIKRLIVGQTRLRSLLAMIVGFRFVEAEVGT